MERKEFERAFEGWHLYRDFYGNATCVEATITYEKEDFFLGVGMGITFEGSYQLRLTDKAFAETGMYKFFMCEKAISVKGLCSVLIQPEEFQIAKGKPFILRLERNGKQFTGYLNGKELLHYEEHESMSLHETGGCGVWIHPQNGATFCDFSCEGEAKPLPAKKDTITSEHAIEYEMDLSDQAKEGRVPCWSVDPRDAAWNLVETNGEHVYQSPNMKGLHQVHLHTFEKDPYVRMNISIDDMTETGNCGLLIRHAPHTAYVKVGYDVNKACWFIEDVPEYYDCKSQRFESKRLEMHSGKTYQIEVQAYVDKVTLRVDGEEILTAEEVRQIGFGRIGLFAENTTLNVHALYAKLPNASSVIDGVVKTYVDAEHFAASTEIEETTDGTLLGICKDLYPRADRPYQTGIYRSYDKGLTFEKVLPGETYSGLDTKGAYQSVLRLKNGKFIQVLLNEKTLVQESDDMIHWKDIGHVLSDGDYERLNRNDAKGYVMIHVNSLAEYEGPDGKMRIFLPIAECKAICDPNTQKITKVHDSVVYYSDDNGYTWTRAKNSTFDVFAKEGYEMFNTFAESKIVKCSDGSLRLYNSRNAARFMCYVESFDFGVTWSGFNTVRELQCARSSFGVVEDPYEPGTYYMAWVNDKALYRSGSHGRTRISLARSYDGKSWHFVGDAEYTSLRYADHMDYLYLPIFQILDPSVTVTKEHVYVTYGLSAFLDRGDVIGQLTKVHHEQRPALTRFEKAKLKDLPWNETSISDMSLLTDYSDEEVLV